jgi:hypothetical protein
MTLSPTTFRLRARVPLALAVLAGLCVPLAIVASAPAGAVTEPPVDYSFYVAPSDTNGTAWQLGCNQADYDNIDVNYDSFVVLDFGVQTSDGSGTILVGSNTEWGNGADALYALNFALGYQQCNHGSHVVLLSVGTTNDWTSSEETESAFLGTQWASVVNAVSQNASESGYSNVDVWGAGDWESWGTFGSLSNWMSSGYSTSSNIPVVNYGSADGCPWNYGDYYGSSYSESNYLCTGDWYQSSNYQDSWGWNLAWAAPEIYYNGPYQNCPGYPAQHIQWQNISMLGAWQYGADIYFMAPFTEAGSCDPTANAYTDFYNALNSYPQTAELPPYLIQIHTD